MARPTTRSQQPGTEVATTQTNALATPVPEFMKGMAGQGTENLSGADVETPRLILLQSVSPQVEEYDNARAGQFWHNMLNEPLGEKIRVVISYVDKRAILWRPRPPVDTGGILARSEDLIHWSPSNANFKVKIDKAGTEVTYNTGKTVAQSRLLEWGSSDPRDPNSPPAATLMYNFVLSFPDHPGVPPAVFSFQRSTSKVARKLLGRLKMSPVPSFGVYYEFESFTEESDGQKFKSLRCTPMGFVQDQAEFDVYKSIYEALKRSGLRMAETQDDADMATASDEADDDRY